MVEYSEEELKNMSPEQVAEIQKQNCIFCKINAGEIPSKKVKENNDFVSILDINPSVQGHVLLLTKQHYQIMPQIPQDVIAKMGVEIKNVSNELLKAFGCEGTTIFIANGFVAGQKAPHFMVHIIPRKDGDEVGLKPEFKDIPEKDYLDTKNKIMSILAPKVQKKEVKKKKGKSKKVVEEKVDLDKVSNLFT